MAALARTSPAGTKAGGIVCSCGASAESGEAFSYACDARRKPSDARADGRAARGVS